MKIPFLDIKQLNSPYELEFKRQFDDFLQSGYYILGDSVRQFEKEFSNYCGTKFCIGTGNGLDALTLILKGYIEIGKLKKKKKVLLSANSYIATVLAIENAGLKPVLIDAHKDTFNLDPSLLPKQPDKDIKAIMVTHLYGQLANMTILKEYCFKHNLLLLSDSSHAHGAISTNNKKAGSLADASGFSFYPTKNLGALGDAGAITTNDNTLAACIKNLRNYGGSVKYKYDYKGVNSRLDELQAKFLSIKLKKLDESNSLKRKIAKRYLSEISNDKIVLPKVKNFNSHVFHQFIVQVTNRNDFTNFLKKNNIGYLIHYPIPPQQQKCYIGQLKGNFPVTDKLSNTVVSLPININLTATEIDYIISKINTF